MDEELIREAIQLDYSQLVMNNVYLHKENERLNKAFDNLENVIRYYVIGNSKYDDITAEYILNRLLQFRVKGSDK